MTFVPDDFDPPVSYVGSGFRLEPLGPEHNERDHEAWMSSVDFIHSLPGFPRGGWPLPMTLEENLADLEAHARDFAERTGFTYSILDGNDVIGCLYIYPSSDDDHDASIASWVRASRASMDAAVRSAVAGWLADEWPFTAPAYVTSVD